MLPGMLGGRQTIRAGCTPRHRAWGHPMSHLGGPWWPLATVALPLRCHFLPIAGGYSWDRSILSPPCPSAHGQYHQLVPPLGTPPDANLLQPAPMGPRRQRGTGHVPISGTQQKIPKGKYCGFCRDRLPPGPHHMAFHLHPQSHFNYAPGRDQFKELLSGAKCW